VLDASERDVVVIAGRGHEVTQAVGQNSLPLEDATEARMALRERDDERRT
jgi:UDP-N-acetylmuramyl tripeptide synthase